MLHLRFGKLLHLGLNFITFTVGITFSVVITFSGDTTCQWTMAGPLKLSEHVHLKNCEKPWSLLIANLIAAVRWLTTVSTI